MSDHHLLTRRGAIAAAAIGCVGLGSVPADAGPKPATGPEEALRAFLRAFENCDLAAMESAFAPGATNFDRAPREPGDLSLYRRKAGMPAGMRQLALALPKTKPGPPYHRVEPSNLVVDRHGDLAIATFELDAADNLGRRTVVLQRQTGRWMIVHIHASNVYGRIS